MMIFLNCQSPYLSQVTEYWYSIRPDGKCKRMDCLASTIPPCTPVPSVGPEVCTGPNKLCAGELECGCEEGYELEDPNDPDFSDCLPSK